jgi:regulator of PEP synthase PpsR (kinase-PPPase family)
VKHIHVHLISDSTGETVSSVARAGLAQFEGVTYEEHVWSLVRTKGQMEKVIAGIEAHPGVAMFTIVDPDLRRMLREACEKRKILCVAPLGPVIRELTTYLGQGTTAQPGRQHELTENYFSRVEAINFALAHDDGQGHWNLEEADIVLVGASRTSKSPTCMYLAYRGFKSANVPFVLESALPENLFSLRNPTVVGLVISPDRLTQIRKSRLQALNHEKDTNYVDEDLVRKEITESRKLFTRHNWLIIDVTRKSVEETAAQIIQFHQERLEKLKS